MKYLLILVAVVCLLLVKEIGALKCVGNPHIYSAVGSTSLVSSHSFSLSSLSSLSSLFFSLSPQYPPYFL